MQGIRAFVGGEPEKPFRRPAAPAPAIRLAQRPTHRAEAAVLFLIFTQGVVAEADVRWAAAAVRNRQAAQRRSVADRLKSKAVRALQRDERDASAA